MQKISIKREQSQAGLSFAERIIEHVYLHHETFWCTKVAHLPVITK